MSGAAVLTIAPKFAPNEPIGSIVSDWYVAMQRMVAEVNLLQASSPFVQSVLGTLNAYRLSAHASPALSPSQFVGPPLVFNTVPTTPFETQLLIALKAATQ